MAEAEATQDGEAPVDPPSVKALDLTNIRGFQVLPVADQAAPAANEDAAPDRLDDETRKLELAKEFAARAKRLAEAVDEALVLANDGTIRWLGDPIAKLVAGEETLKPRAIILADDALSAEGREAVQQRVALWLSAHVRKALGPLLSLAEPEAVPEGVRDLALKLSQSLGVLERERVRAQVKALDQNARGALRKLGVRFGAYYIYLPALLKPASRTLCAQLWALVRRDAEKEAAAERLLHFASSGRTSFAVEAPASGEVYRVAGFRLCGDRAVRVDIVERLMDLIRAALPRQAHSGAQTSSGEGGAGFVVTNQMTSLTGCSGEHFASILRSLGFAGHKVKKSEFLAATRKASDPAAPAAQDEASAAPEPGNSAPSTEPAADDAPPPAAAASEQSTPGRSEPANEESSPAGEAGDGAAPPTPVEAAASLVAPEAASAQEDGASAEAQASPAEKEKSGEDELIEVWRPAPRRSRHVARERGRPPPSGEAASAEGRARPQGAPRTSWRDRRRAAPPPPAESARPADGSPPDGAQGPAGEPAREARRPSGRREAPKGGKPDERRAVDSARSDKARERPPPPEPRKASVNLDSPFAKLLDLKPLLKQRDTTK
jgi:ATP-dependent RNA helicase SUPV3L1/SUV3